jgi:signal transduction histidine kinase
MPDWEGGNSLLGAFFGISIFLVFTAIGFCSFFFHPLLSAPLYTVGMVYFFLLRGKLPEASLITFPHLAIFGTMVFILFLLVRILSKRFIREKEMVRELAKTKERLLQQEKLSVLATFAAGIVHEISNPLTHMHGNLDFLAGYVDVLTETSKTGKLPSRSPESLDFIHRDIREILTDYKKGFGRMKEITRSLKQFFRSRDGDRDIIDLSGVLRTSVDYFVRYEALVEFITRIEDNLIFTCNAGDFLSIFQNILGNAVEAVEHKGTVWITARRIDGMLDFRIRDNGSGIPKEMVERIFDPFFTTKPRRENMGIGLTLCKSLIETYNGVLEITSRVEEYTEVTVLIPAE